LGFSQKTLLPIWCPKLVTGLPLYKNASELVVSESEKGNQFMLAVFLSQSFFE